MFPTLLQIGPLTIKSFGLMAALGFFAGYLVMKRLSAKVAGVAPDDVAQLLVLIMLGGAFGARLAYVAEHWSQEFAGRPFFDVFRFDQGGLMFYGGLAGAILAIAAYARARRKDFVALLDLAAAVLPLGHAFGRVGCFLNGCCYGRVAASNFAIRYPAGSGPWFDQVASGLITRGAASTLPLVPSQLVEALLNLALFAFLFRLAKRTGRRGLLAGAYLVSYALVRFFTETLRSDPRMAVGPLSVAQFICLFVFAAGILFIALPGARRA